MRAAAALLVCAAAGAARAEELPPLSLPAIDPGVLAKGSSWEIAAANGRVQATGQGNGEDDEVTSVGLELRARLFHSLETPLFGYSALATAGDTFSRRSDEDGSRLDNALRATLLPEGRLYVTPPAPMFVFVSAGIDATLLTTRLSPEGGESSDDSVMPGSVAIAAGVGAGRVLAIDPVVRLRRIEEALARRGVLRGAISPEVGSEVIRTWYALRNDVGSYRTLAYTAQLLEQRGLVGPLDLRATYEALAILEDPFIVERRAGWDARVGLGVVQTFSAFDEEDPGDPDTEPDPQLAILASAQWERPFGTTRQLSVRGKASYELGDSDERARTYGVRAFVDYTTAFYNDTYDPLGALIVAFEGGAFDARGVPETTQLGLDASAGLRYARTLNRGSIASLGAAVSVRNDESYAIVIEAAVVWGVASGFYTPYVQPAGL